MATQKHTNITVNIIHYAIYILLKMKKNTIGFRVSG